MMISSSPVTEAPQENFWAKNLCASLRSISVDEKTDSLSIDFSYKYFLQFKTKILF